MTRIVISGASGDLARRVTQQLLAADPLRELTLVTRTPANINVHGPHVDVRPGDFEKPELFDDAYRDGDILLLVSGLNLGRRTAEHRKAIEAAKKSGIRHIVYTSVGGVQPAIRPYRRSTTTRVNRAGFDAASVFVKDADHAQALPTRAA